MLKRTSMEFCGGHYFVVIFHPHRAPSTSDTLEITDFISDYHLQDITGYAAKLYDENIVGIYSSPCTDMKKIKEQFSLLHQNVCAAFSIMLTVGIGCWKPDLLSVSSSFLEASTALDYHFIYGKNKLISFYDLKLNPYAGIEYPQNQIDTLCLQIKSGQEKPMIHSLNVLFSYIRENANSMYAAKSLCYDVTNSIIKTLKDLESSSDNLQFPDLLTLTAFETIEELEQTLQQFCQTACSYVNARKPMTLSDYIKLYKIELAKKMLVETNDPLDKIIQLLGYYDTSSFIRMFKKSEGMTPGEFRKTYQK